MKYLAAFAGGSLTLIILRIISALFNFEITDFLVGWISCVGWYTAMKIYEIVKFTKEFNQ